jgi:hypothetical protein
MNAAVLLHLDGSWTLIEENRVRTVPEYPRLAAPTLVLTDFGGAVSGVSTIHENKCYAEALIGRRLRDDGAIDNEKAKVLIHHGASVPGGWQALYTAMPMVLWRRMRSWIASQEEHCLVIPQTALMHRLIRRDGEGIVFHGGRKISVLAQGQGKLHYFSARVRGDTEDDLHACATTLAGRVRQEQAQEAFGQRLAFRWYSFGKDGLAGIFAAHLEGGADEVERESYLQEDGGHRPLPLKALAPCLSERIALNTPVARASYFAERNIGYFSLYAGVLVTACLAVDLAFFFQTGAVRAETAALREEIQKIAAPASGGAGAAGALPSDFLATRDFIDLLSAAETGTDPGDLLQDLRAAAGRDIKLLRIFMQPEDRHIVIEGWVDAANGGDRQLAGFLADLRRLGFEPEAANASLASRAYPGSAFAYQLSPASRGKGGTL